MLSLVFGRADDNLCVMKVNREDTIEELRAYVARGLKLEDVPPELWDEFDEEGLVDDVLNPNYVLDREELVDLAERRIEKAITIATSVGVAVTTLGEARTGRRKVDKRRYVPALPADDPVRQRGEVLSLYSAKVAEQDEGVRRFREEVLGGTISPEEAEALVASPAAAMFPPAWFGENRVPLVGHTARFIGSEEAPVGDSRWGGGCLLVEWTGGSLRLPLDGAERSVGVGLFMDFGGMTSWFRGEWPPVTARGKERASTIVARGRRGSVLDELAQVGLHLTGRFPWEQHEAERFVLTGEPVEMPPLFEELTEGDEGYPSVIKMTVAPWVPAKTVKSVYTQRRKELAPVQMTSPLRLAIFRFVMARSDVKLKDGGMTIEGPSWRRLMADWNEQLPAGHEWHTDDVRNFSGDFREAFAQLITRQLPFPTDG